MRKKITALLLILSIAFCFLTGCSIAVYDDTETTAEDSTVTELTEDTDGTSTTSSNGSPATDPAETSEESYIEVIDIDGVYTSCDDVALYIHTYDCLPSNFMTKSEARALGWEGGSLEPYAPGMCIGGDYFGNYEGLLPEESGREYRECDIDTLGASSRGAHRIIYSNDGLIYCTEDHYESFTLLYGEP